MSEPITYADVQHLEQRLHNCRAMLPATAWQGTLLGAYVQSTLWWFKALQVLFLALEACPPASRDLFNTQIEDHVRRARETLSAMEASIARQAGDGRAE